MDPHLYLQCTVKNNIAPHNDFKGIVGAIRIGKSQMIPNSIQQFSHCSFRLTLSTIFSYLARSFRLREHCAVEFSVLTSSSTKEQHGSTPTTRDVQPAKLCRTERGTAPIILNWKDLETIRGTLWLHEAKIGRASCRERVCQYFSNSGAARAL